jgi:pyrroline-5-carboxylate reductase
VQVSGGIWTTNRSLAGAALVPVHPKITAMGTQTEPEANKIAVRHASIVTSAVKPYMIHDLLGGIHFDLRPDAIVVSVAVETPLAVLDKMLPESVVALRAMPNTPAAITMGVTGQSRGRRASAAQFELIKKVSQTVGVIAPVEESMIDVLSSISGSGPVYFYFLVEQLTYSAVAKDFTREEAAVLVNETFIGAANLLAQTGQSPAELRHQVTSPKGTTEQAIAVLGEARLEELFARATAAAVSRADEIASGG